MSFIKSEQIGAVLRLTLDRPEKKNAITQEMYQSLANKINEAASDFGIRAVVICSNGDSFTAGNDINDFANDPQMDEGSPVFSFLFAIHNFPKPLIFGRLTARDYEDDVASDPRIDALRAKINCTEDKSFSADYHDPKKRSIANAMTITLSDGTVLDEVVVEYPVGHKRRREEGIPLLKAKYQTNLARIFDASQKAKIEELTLNYEKLSATRVDAVMDLFVKR